MSDTAFNGHLVIRIGADLVESVQLQDDDGLPLDVSSYTFAAKGRPSLDADAAVFTLNVQTITAASGEIAFVLDAATTADLLPGRGVWEADYTVGAITLPLLQKLGTYEIRKRGNR